MAKAFGEYKTCNCRFEFIMSSGAGADFVMMGGMLAGHDQSGECAKRYQRSHNLNYLTL